MRKNLSRTASLAVITAVYAIAIIIGCLTFIEARQALPVIWALLVSDVTATVFVWGMGLVYENVSVYDPYWSVAPPVYFTAWAFFTGQWGTPVVLLLVAVWYWGIRLTGNWAYTFKGLGHEDWRYTRYREMLSPVLFQLTNFFGLNMMPTLLVFVCMLPGFGIFDAPAAVNGFTWMGFGICLAAVTVQLVADRQSHRFRKETPGQVCDAGLWKHGRHPNYFGEVLFWWGIWAMYASLFGIDVLVLGPLAMTALFVFISIPMMERRQLENKPGYRDYKEKTRLFI